MTESDRSKNTNAGCSIAASKARLATAFMRLEGIVETRISILSSAVLASNDPDKAKKIIEQLEELSRENRHLRQEHASMQEGYAQIKQMSEGVLVDLSGSIDHLEKLLAPDESA